MRLQRALGTGIAAAILMTTLARPQASPAPKVVTINQDSFSGSFYSSVFNFDPSTGKANMGLFSGTGSVGAFTSQIMSQFFADGLNCVVPNGSNTGTELKLVGLIGSVTFTKTGDSILEHGDPGDLIQCFDTQTFKFHMTGAVHVIGGTGHYAGASGTESIVGDGAVIDVGDGNWTFGFLQASSQLTITVPQ